MVFFYQFFVFKLSLFKPLFKKVKKIGVKIGVKNFFHFIYFLFVGGVCSCEFLCTKILFATKIALKEQKTLTFVSKYI